MSNKQLRTNLQTALQSLATGDLRINAIALLGTLGYSSHKTLALPVDPTAFVKEVEALLGGSKQINPAHASLADWQSAAFLFQLTNDELPALAAGQTRLLTETGGVQAWQVESFVFLALDLKPGTWSRTRLAALTREVNRLFPMPAVLLFRHPREDRTPLLSVSVIHRRANKRDASLDVIDGKVSIIKDIDLGAPHAAHLRILESMALTEVDAKYVPSSFDKLYAAWLKVLDVKALNDRFYKDLAEWYYWAIRKGTGVVFPKGQPLEQANDPATNGRPTVALIRMLTRLIFVWFLKEKRLVPAQLFDEKALAGLLKTAPHQHGDQGNYYKAILQNLFFATLNTETTDEDEDGHKQRVWREAAGPKRMDKYLIHTVYRYKSEFKDADAALALFRKIPFLNGGLFECLDKLGDPEQRFQSVDIRKPLMLALPLAEASVVDELPKGFRLPEGELQSRQEPMLPRKVTGGTPQQGELPLEGGKQTPEGGKQTLEGGKQTLEGGKQDLPPLPPELAQRLPLPGKRMGEMALRRLIRDLCGWHALRGEELATFLAKDLKYLRNRHLSAMVQSGELVFQYPESPNHQLQAYKLPNNP